MKTLTVLNSLAEYRQGLGIRSEIDLDLEDIKTIVFTSRPYYGSKGQIKSIMKRGYIIFKNNKISKEFDYGVKDLSKILEVVLRRTKSIKHEYYCKVKRKTYVCSNTEYRLWESLVLEAVEI